MALHAKTVKSPLFFALRANNTVKITLKIFRASRDKYSNDTPGNFRASRANTVNVPKFFALRAENSENTQHFRASGENTVKCQQFFARVLRAVKNSRAKKCARGNARTLKTGAQINARA